MGGRYYITGVQLGDRRKLKMKCKCGFKFAGAGEYRNCQAFINEKGQGGVVCPKCGTAYIGNQEVKIKRQIRNKK